MSVERVIFGRLRRVPTPECAGDMLERTRWRVLRDGLADVIRLLPASERGLGARLGEAWAFCDSRLDEACDEDGKWPALF